MSLDKGPLIIVSGPAGSGKSTLIHRVQEAAGKYPLRLAVSATTREPRAGEKDGVDYHFWTSQRFEEQRAARAFLEYAQVHRRDWYGTPRSEVAGYREKGIGVILDIDVEGAAQVRRVCPDAVSVFIKLPVWEEYEKRLRKRQSETDESIARRLETARRELERIGEYDHVIVNDDLETASRELLDWIGRQFPTPAGA
jgi:guanylate kinase